MEKNLLFSILLTDTIIFIIFIYCQKNRAIIDSIVIKIWSKLSGRLCSHVTWLILRDICQDSLLNNTNHILNDNIVNYGSILLKGYEKVRNYNKCKEQRET